MVLLLDFAVARVNRSGGKKNHGNHSNNNIDRRVTSSVNNNNNKDSTEIKKTIKDSEEFGIF